MSVKLRAILNIEGRVQGVFFRASARREAKRLGICGYAENTSEGGVRIVVEGTREVLEEFLRWCEKGPPLASVKNVAVEWQPATGTFDDFSIR